MKKTVFIMIYGSCDLTGSLKLIKIDVHTFCCVNGLKYFINNIQGVQRRIADVDFELQTNG